MAMVSVFQSPSITKKLIGGHKKTKDSKKKIREGTPAPPNNPSPEIRRWSDHNTLRVFFTDLSIDTYKGAHIARSEANTLWITFYKKIIRLENVAKVTFS